jgi:transcriptional regulator with XRE-family HTH domain
MPKKNQKSTIGQRIRQLRREREWSQEEFGNKVNIHWQSVGRYEKDQVIPTADILMRMAQAFGVSADYLLFGDNESLRVQNKELFKRFQQLDRVNPDKIKGLLEVMDVYISRENAAKELLTTS